MQAFFKPKRFFFFSASVFILSAIICLYVGIRQFPGNVYMIDGRGGGFEFLPPFSAGINYREQEAVPAAGIHDAPVLENIKIDGALKESADSYGTQAAEMTLSLFGIPVKNVSVDVLADVEVVPCGMTVGITIETTGVIVLGTGSVISEDGFSSRPSEGKIKSGDILLKVDGRDIEDWKQFSSYIENLPPGGKTDLTFLRNGQTSVVSVICAVSRDDGKNKLGLWIRDRTRGIGTVTYYNPSNERFGALGHGIIDVDTKQLIPVREGSLSGANIVSVKKGKRGSPGELVGEVDKLSSLGTITENTSVGLFGTVNKNSGRLPSQPMKIALQTDVHEGPAVILSNVSGYETREYDVYIERVNRFSSDDSRGMVIRITDQELITRTNGIVQGMSGCPIIQGGCIVGAVTHVFVQNPLKGYGIFIENMIKQERKT